MAEMIDVYNANLEPLGTMDRLEAHLTGQWHKTFHCWVVSSENNGSILFQLRSPEATNFPNMFDISAAGHLAAGESTEQGFREVREELGIPSGMGSLHSLGYRIEVADQSNGQLNREYQAVYMLQLNLPLSTYTPQVKEVAGLFWLNVRQGLALFSHATKQAAMEGIQYDKASSSWKNLVRQVSVEDFLPRIQNYYLTACIMAERLLENKLPVAIS